MKNVKWQLLLGVFFFSVLTGCDTREDWFYRFGDAPEIEFLVDPENRFVAPNGEVYANVDLFWGEETSIQFHLSDTHGEVLDWRFITNQIQMSNFFRQYYLNLNVGEWSDNLTFPTEGLDIVLDKVSKSITFRELTTSAENLQNLINSFGILESLDFYSPTTHVVMFRISARNILGVEGTGRIRLNIHANPRPIPVIEIREIANQPLERNISIRVDDPRKRIVMYEFCINGTTLGRHGYEFNNMALPAGEAAFGGVYISSPYLSSINHAFQRTGTHTVEVRVKDQWGFWSSWVREEIIIPHSNDLPSQ